MLGAGTKNGVGIATDPTLTGGGFSKERLSPGVSPSVPPPYGFGHQDMSPGARAGAGLAPGQSGGCYTDPDRSGRLSEPGLLLWRLKRPDIAASCISIHRRRSSSLRLSGDRSLRSQQSGMVLSEGSAIPFLLRNDAIIASSSLRFSSSWFGRRSRQKIRLRSRWIENAQDRRVGQGRECRLIHFLPKCQWTRVDKSTVRRIKGNFLATAARKPWFWVPSGPAGRAGEGAGRSV